MGAFQQLMAKMIAGLEGVDAFLDDIIIHSEDEEKHYAALTALFKRLRDYGFHLRLDKCRFNQKEIKYLGHIVDAKGIRPDPAKISVISQMPPPTDVTTLRSFLGAVNFYGKFVQATHQLRHPLDNLLKNDAKFIWSQECQHAFSDIKRVMHPNRHRSSHYASVSQRHHQSDFTRCQIAQSSKITAEQNYSQIEKEALALVFACTKFHRMLWGRRFRLQTDHQPSLKNFGCKKGIPVHTANRLQRWALTLLGYDFDIEFVSTHNFGYADVLSRLINNHEKPDEEAVIAMVRAEADVSFGLQDTLQNLPVTAEMMQDSTAKDPVLQKVIYYIQDGWPVRSKAIPEIEVRPFFGHRESYSLVGRCVMMMDRVVVPVSFQKSILKWIHQGHPGIERSKAIARGIVFWPRIDKDIDDYVRRCSDCASAAKSPTQANPQPWPTADGPWQHLHLDFAVHWKDTTILFTHPQSNGQAERFVDTLKRSLKKIIGGGETSTATALQTFLHIYRSTPSAVLGGKSLDQSMIGRSMRTTLDLLRTTCSPVMQQTKHNRSFKAGSPVFAKAYSSNESWKWMPGVVLERIGNVNYNILLNHQVGRRKVLRSHIDQLEIRSKDEPLSVDKPVPLQILIESFELQQQAVPVQ
ncbi:uncharacterized protein K02A2.6-like [Wyeomyia smithii]|uniref:uncharacterized protein K02A2.6-like n=1 Tax=Wyeomyia smithii TaxID=174621 RepID=UPI002467DC80|nr:uncharacterized protein K02A2.6-like [Wyeomyia smithii]